jgi:uncharacterized low-complexity protein
MSLKKIITTAAIAGALTMGVNTASANTGAYNAFNAHYVTNASCATCHQDPNAGGSVKVHTTVGTAWIANGGTKNAGPTTQAQWDALDQAIGTQFGGVDPNWTLPVAPAPSSGGGGGGCIASSATTPLMMVLAMLSLGFFVRRKKG